jgi:NADH dehydrogenase FAD-containing subunit
MFLTSPVGSYVSIGVKVFLNSKVRLIDADGVMVNDRRIYSRTVLWAAGAITSSASIAAPGALDDFGARGLLRRGV